MKQQSLHLVFLNIPLCIDLNVHRVHIPLIERRPPAAALRDAIGPLQLHRPHVFDDGIATCRAPWPEPDLSFVQVPFVDEQIGKMSKVSPVFLAAFGPAPSDWLSGPLCRGTSP
jgi:hypothetical protein